MARYDGPGNDYDTANALAVDVAGNVYVTGRSAGSESESDYATIKYNPDGSEAWVARYDGPGNDYDTANALAVDAAGNVYVTGGSRGSESFNDYATIKYNPDGSEAWVSRYNGPGNDSDWAHELAVDEAGSVYVTGNSEGSESGSDYATIKYNSDGSEAWVSRYDGPGNDDDEAYALAVDEAGNVYVTGQSWVSEGAAYDYAAYDYATIKYNSDGSEAWVSRYDGPGNGPDYGNALDVDAAGNVYVTGQSWVSEGAPYGYAAYDYATIKYNSDGSEAWVSRYNGLGGSNDIFGAMALDTEGNVYVTGESRGSEGGFDYATIKYNSDGTEVWVARYDGPGNDYDNANALAVDAAGNVYVTGRSAGSESDYDYATIKYNPDGSEAWVARYDGPENSTDQANALAVDAASNVYVTGWSEDDYATIKYNSDGTEVWVARYDGPGNSTDQANALALDEAGNVYVTGWSEDDYATIKYNSDGTEVWVARYDGPGNSTDQANALALDEAGNVYVTGWSEDDYATIKYNPDGSEAWVSRYNGPGNDHDWADALVVDGAGNVFVTGSSKGIDSYYDYATIKYNPDGSEAWVVRYDGPGNGKDQADALAVDGAGNVYVTGVSQVDYATIKYNPDGSEAWVTRHQCGGDNYNPNALAVDGAGNVYVAGTTVLAHRWPPIGPPLRSVYTTIKYVQPGYPVSSNGVIQPFSFRLNQNYPNPFNPTTTISYGLPETGSAKLTIYDIRGQEITTLQNATKPPGNYQVQWNGIDQSGHPVSTGVYFARLQAGEYSQTIKMLYLR